MISTQDPLPFILKQTGARDASAKESVQSLWSGYGEITRYQLYGCSLQTIIVKHICPPQHSRHPRGWNTDLGHQRKLKSYEVETAWYADWAQRCHPQCLVPHCLGVERTKTTTLILLQDLDSAGFPLRKVSLNETELKACLSWLAQFHACFMGEQPTGLWPVGSYWHLDTRPDELAAMEDGPLKQAAQLIDSKLNQARYKTLVHGDAKVANFCFSESGADVAAVDFQYVGGGCGIKDLAYFLGSCLTEDECEQQQDQCLEYYFTVLEKSLKQQGKNLDFAALEKEWRELYPMAWADFYRFLQGWMPTHKKINNYSSRITQQALNRLSID